MIQLPDWRSQVGVLYWRAAISPLVISSSFLLLVACGGSSSTPAPADSDSDTDSPVDMPVDTPVDTPTDPPADTPSGPAPPQNIGSALDVAGGNFYLSGNNSDLLTGPVIGTDADDPPIFRKELTLSIDNPDSDFAIGPVYAIANTTGTSADVVGVIQNVSGELICGALVDPGEVRDSDGSVLDELEFVFTEVIGSAATNSSAGTTRSCLQPDEIAYFKFLGFFSAEAASSMVIDSVGSASDPSIFTVYDAGIVPLSYSIAETTSAGQIRVDVLSVNQSAETLRLGGGTFFPLDGDGKPLGVANADGVVSVQVAPGEEVAISFTTAPAFAGPAAVLRAVLEFGDGNVL